MLIRCIVPEKGYRLLSSADHMEPRMHGDKPEGFLQQPHLGRIVFNEENVLVGFRFGLNGLG